MTTRRQFLVSTTKWAVGSTAALTLAGCGDIIRDALDAAARSCPTDPAESGGVNWFPDVAHPVYYGVTDVDASTGAPGPARIWYPTYDGAVMDAPMLKMCLTRWPVVLFLHGQQPSGCTVPEYYKRWDASTLARSGYVVVAPQLAQQGPPSPSSPDVDLALRFLDWTRSGWRHSEWVSPRATALIGHSYGLPIAAYVALRRPVDALVSLSGAWSDLGSAIGSLRVPSMSMWGADESGLFVEAGGGWRSIQLPKYAASFPGGQHFDYFSDLPGCSEERGTCPSMAGLSRDLTALFLTRFVRVPLSRARVGADMTLPSYTLTTRQQLFASGQLATIRALESRRLSGCSIDLRWELPSGNGSRRIG